MEINKEEKPIKSLIQCISVPDYDLAAQILEYLLDKKELSVRDLTKVLNVSYPLILRVVNDLAGLGIVETSKLKVEGRGRPRKLVKINTGKLLDMLGDCRKNLDEAETLLKQKQRI
ncbi:MAG: transcriptional regulator [Caldisphaera sp.]|nr:helix-turn-helix domain-containing protein [Caldisphaera sp.]